MPTWSMRPFPVLHRLSREPHAPFRAEASVGLGRTVRQLEEHGRTEQPEDRQFHDRRCSWSAFRPPFPALRSFSPSSINRRYPGLPRPAARALPVASRRPQAPPVRARPEWSAGTSSRSGWAAAPKRLATRGRPASTLRRPRATASAVRRICAGEPSRSSFLPCQPHRLAATQHKLCIATEIRSHRAMRHPRFGRASMHAEAWQPEAECCLRLRTARHGVSASRQLGPASPPGQSETARKLTTRERPLRSTT